MKIIVNSKEEIKTLDTATKLKVAVESMRKYHEIEIAYQKYLMTFKTMHHYHEKIIQESGYVDQFDFLYDYGRYKMGLPIYIDIVMKGEEK